MSKLVKRLDRWVYGGGAGVLFKREEALLALRFGWEKL
jgi:hypothetical protein